MSTYHGRSNGRPQWKAKLNIQTLTVTVCSQLVGVALPTDRVADWCIAKDSVQAISCLIEALHLFNTNGKHLLYETSVLGILLILQHLAQNQSYLTIITGRHPWLLCQSALWLSLVS